MKALLNILQMQRNVALKGTPQSGLKYSLFCTHYIVQSCENAAEAFLDEIDKTDKYYIEVIQRPDKRQKQGVKGMTNNLLKGITVFWTAYMR